MTDLQKLIGDAREAAFFNGSTHLLNRLADALEALNRENEKLQGKLQEVREVCSSDWINLANSTEQFLADNYGLVVRTEDVIDAVDGDEPIETPIYFKAYLDMLAERDALRAQLDNMTTEWGSKIPRARRPFEHGEDELGARRSVAKYDHLLVKRQVTPWVEVTDE